MQQGVESQASQRTKSEQSVWQESHAMNSGVWCTRFKIKRVCPISDCKGFDACSPYYVFPIIGPSSFADSFNP